MCKFYSVKSDHFFRGDLFFSLTNNFYPIKTNSGFFCTDKVNFFLTRGLNNKNTSKFKILWLRKTHWFFVTTLRFKKTIILNCKQVKNALHLLIFCFVEGNLSLHHIQKRQVFKYWESLFKLVTYLLQKMKS